MSQSDKEFSELAFRMAEKLGLDFRAVNVDQVGLSDGSTFAKNKVRVIVSFARQQQLSDSAQQQGHDGSVSRQRVLLRLQVDCLRARATGSRLGPIAIASLHQKPFWLGGQLDLAKRRVADGDVRDITDAVLAAQLIFDQRKDLVD